LGASASWLSASLLRSFLLAAFSGSAKEIF
jgi:hypothetical protein